MDDFDELCAQIAACKKEDKLILQAKNNVKKKVFEEYFKYQLEESPEKVMDSDRQIQMYNYVLAKREAGIKEYKSTHVFITVNPRPEIPFETLRGLVEKCVKKKWVTEYIYAFEQRGEAIDKVHGYHVHMQLNRPADKVPAQCKREVVNTFKDIVGNPQHIDFSFRKDPAPGIAYIKGMKKDKEKDKKCETDKAWRASLGLQDFYATPSLSS